MALRRSIGGLSAVLNSLRQLVLPEASSAACLQPHHAAPTLPVSLRSFWLASGSPACPPSAAAVPVLASGCRQFSSASPSRQQAAAAAAEPAAAAGAQEESLEQIRARIFGTYIGGHDVPAHLTAGPVAGRSGGCCQCPLHPTQRPRRLGLQRARCMQQPALADPRRRPTPAHCTARHFLAAGNGQRSGRKVLRKALVGEKVAGYYPPDPIKADPLMLNLKAEQ